MLEQHLDSVALRKQVFSKGPHFQGPVLGVHTCTVDAWDPKAVGRDQLLPVWQAFLCQDLVSTVWETKAELPHPTPPRRVDMGQDPIPRR